MNKEENAATCNVMLSGEQSLVLLGHGAGGKLTQQLLKQVFYPAFANTVLKEQTDSAVLRIDADTVAFTTDSYVVSPWAFAGGNIGHLAICGTINDLAMVGAVPVGISAAFIIEEGLSLQVLKEVVATMAKIANEAGVPIVTGDTKVVEKGKGDGIFITTSGVGKRLWAADISPARVQAGDLIVLSGDIGRHAVAVQSARQGFSTEPLVTSDVAFVHGQVRAMFDAGVTPHCMRDLTRGGLGAALLEIAEHARKDIEIDETTIPLLPGVKGVVEALGLDALFLANEGRFISFVSPDEVNSSLDCLRRSSVGGDPIVIGQVINSQEGRVILKNAYGTRRFLRMPLHEPLPRIC